MNEATITLAEANLQRQDTKLGELIKRQQLAPRDRPTDYFAALCRSIIGQQVSVAAASTIFGRFEELTGVKALNVLNLTEAHIKQIGLSRQKAGYLSDLAQHFCDNPKVYDHLEQCSDEEVIKDLTLIKGIGVWTAQMFLMFTLHRPDVFAPKDAGLQRAMMKLYGWKELPSEQILEAKAAVWAPYRTVACLHLWHSLDNTPK